MKIIHKMLLDNAVETYFLGQTKICQPGKFLFYFPGTIKYIFITKHNGTFPKGDDFFK